jgi:hypothetical protein
MKNIPTAIRVVATLLIFILLVVAALLAGAGGPDARPEARVEGGGGAGGHPRMEGGGRAGGHPRVEGGGGAGGHALGDALHDIRREQVTRHGNAHIVGPPPRSVFAPRPNIVTRVGGGGGGKKPKPKKPWADYDTWEAMDKDKGASLAYWDDLTKLNNTLELDFSEVRKSLAKTVYDNREWAGRINYVKGKLEVVELVPSPYAVGEGPLSRQTKAMVPAEVMAKLEGKPGLLLFHTHPGEAGGSAMPSGVDMSAALNIAYTGRYAAELVVSPYGVVLYGPSSQLREKVWDVDLSDPDADNKVRLTTLRHAADLLGAFNGSRSWKSPWSIQDYSNMARQYGVEYVVFPNDNYAAVDQRAVYRSLCEVDHVTHQGMLATIKEKEDVAREVAREVARVGQKTGGQVRRVRFAPGV